MSEGTLIPDEYLNGDRPRHDEDPVSASPVVRGLRWRRRRALSEPPRDQVVLVSDLAGAAGRAGRGLQADRRAAAPAVASPTSLPEAKDRDLVVLHTSTPSFSSDVKTVRALKAANPNLKIGMIGAKVAVDAGRLAAGLRGARFRRAQRVRLHHQGGRRRPRLRQHRRPVVSRRATAASCTTTSAPILHNMDELPFVSPVYKRDLDDRELLHRLSAAPVSVVLHRARLQIALHLLPVAADRRRARLPHPQRRSRHRRAEMGEEGLPAGQGSLLRRRHADRQPAARRGARPRDRQARHHLGLQRQGQRAAQDA